MIEPLGLRATLAGLMAARLSAADLFRLNFRELLHRKGRKQTDVAIKAGLSKSWPTGIKTGTPPSLEAVDLIAQELGVEVAELFAQPKPDPLRHTSHLTLVGTALGVPDVQQVVRESIHTLIKELPPDKAAEAAAALIERLSTPRPPDPQPASPSRARDSRRRVPQVTPVRKDRR